MVIISSFKTDIEEKLYEDTPNYGINLETNAHYYDSYYNTYKIFKYCAERDPKYAQGISQSSKGKAQFTLISNNPLYGKHPPILMTSKGTL